MFFALTPRRDQNNKTEKILRFMKFVAAFFAEDYTPKNTTSPVFDVFFSLTPPRVQDKKKKRCCLAQIS